MTKNLIEKYRGVYGRIAGGSSSEDLYNYRETPGIIRSLLALAGQHHARSRGDNKTSDLENRIVCIDTEWRFDTRCNRLIDRPKRQYQDNQVYQRILESYSSSGRENDL